ncbi:uncharacterized protein CTRU02_214763 [Colletotrichum truncatum]|uniref:Uncharacterized protein n=1 Tax=Colletotrichum truncatum TaxID=5467 RepID=A0ACC3YFQ2_COLTU|nr:uncharacterized protein CTRU02_09712 [Colletotrichum truncatum]KAF6788394.1 hypothetical protein CTRU02_09712 [Colletotrichum truncatum]
MAFLKMVAIIRRRSGMTRREFFNYHFQVHGSLSTGPSKDLAPKIYYQTHFFDSAYSNESAAQPTFSGHDDTTELYFNDISHVGAVFSSDHVKSVVGPDGRNFNDMAGAIALLSQEQTIYGKDAASNTGLVAKYHLQGADSPEDGSALAAELQDDILAAFAPTARTITWDVRKPDNLGILQYFGSQDGPKLSLILSVYLKDEERSIEAFREAQEAFERKVGQKISKNVSFVCFGKRALIFDHVRGLDFDPSRQPVLF